MEYALLLHLLNFLVEHFFHGSTRQHHPAVLSVKDVLVNLPVQSVRIGHQFLGISGSAIKTCFKQNFFSI